MCCFLFRYYVVSYPNDVMFPFHTLFCLSFRFCVVSSLNVRMPVVSSSDFVLFSLSMFGCYVVFSLNYVWFFVFISILAVVVITE